MKELEKIEKGIKPLEEEKEKKRPRWEVEKLKQLEENWKKEGEKTEKELEKALEKARQEIKKSFGEKEK